MGRGRSTTLDQETAIRGCVMMGYTAPKQVYRHLEERDLLDGDNRVSEKTIARRIREYTPADESGPWSLLDADPEEAQRIIPVFKHAFGETFGRVWLSRAIAGWVNRVCAVADPPDAWAWSFAVAYHRVTARQDDTRCLDLLLMYRVWETGVPKTPEEYLQIAERRKDLQQFCQQVSPVTWKKQWSDLQGFLNGVAFSSQLPPWADDEWEPPESESA